MSNSAQTAVGSVATLYRYPVKSMMGEELEAAEVTVDGLRGDRAYALIDAATGKIVSAKNPRRWPELFNFRASFSGPPAAGKPVGPVRIILPDGTALTSDQGDVEEVLSGVLGREVRLSTAPPASPSLEEYWPDLDGLDHRDTVTDEAIRPGSFFDGAPVHVLTTATIRRLAELCPDGRFDARRYRPNIVVEPTGGRNGFVENEWVGRTLALGNTVRLKIERPCPRCVMTTLAQGDLPADPAILRTAAQHNKANVGVYASVISGGTVRRGDAVRLEQPG
jgi:uncharacterized protein YcbX